MKMHQSPELWNLITLWVAEHRGELLSAFLAAAMAILRGLYSGGGRAKLALDAAMCSMIAWFIKDVLMILSFDPGWAMVSSVFIGYLGTDYLGSVLKRVVGNRSGTGNANQ
jgi:lambda family phage holin